MAFKNIQQLNLRIPEFDKDLNLIRFRELFEQIRLFTVDVNNNVNFNKSAFDAHISNAFNPLLARIDNETTGLDALNTNVATRLLLTGANADANIKIINTTFKSTYDDRNAIQDLDFKNAPAKGATATSGSFNSNAGMQEYHNKVRDYTKDHIDNKNNPHSVTAGQLGAATTSDLSSGLNLKVDKTTTVGGANLQSNISVATLKENLGVTALETGKVDKTFTISELTLQNNITNEQLRNAIGLATEQASGLLSAVDKERLNTIINLLGTSQGDENEVVDTIKEVLAVFAQYPEGATIADALNAKVDKVPGQALSDRNFTQVFENKLNEIDAGAQVNVQADWEQTITDADDFIKNKPSIFTQNELTPQIDDPENPGTDIPNFDAQGALDERYYTQKEVDDFRTNTIGNRTYTEENNINNENSLTTSLDDIDQALGNRTYRGDGEEGNNHVVTDEQSVTNSILALDTETERLENNKIKLDGSNSAIDELSFKNKVDNERISKLFVEGCCIKYQHDDGLQIRLGKELVFRNFKNTSGSAIAKGTPVMFGGQEGLTGNTVIKPATVDTNEFWNLIDFPQAFFGLASQDIDDGEIGGVTWFGDVEDLPLNLSIAQPVYFDPDTGGLTNTRPGEGKPEIVIGIVRRQTGNNATIFVRPTVYPRLKDLMGVRETNIANNEAFVYDAALGFFVNKEIYTKAVADNTFVLNTKVGGTTNGNIPIIGEDGIILPQYLGEAYSDVYVGYGTFDLTDPQVPILLELYPPDQWDVGEDEPITEAVSFEKKTNTIYITKNVTANATYRYSVLTQEFVGLVPSTIGLGNIAGTAYPGNEGQDNRDRIVAIENGYATNTNLNTHVTDTNNPHVVTAAQVGALADDHPAKDVTSQKITNWDAAYTHSTVTTGNPHGVTKDNVGLSNVLDYGLASEAEAKQGTSDEAYMTPLRTKQAIEQLSPAPDLSVYDSHIADSTIHFTKASLVKGDVGLGNVDDVQQIPLTQKGQPNGVATLDSAGLVPANQLPSFVDDVLEFADIESFPETGETGKIYVDIATSKVYRWTGSVYVEIANTLDFATKEEAEAGTDTSKAMNAARTKDAILELAPAPEIATKEEAEAGIVDDKFMTPERTAEAISVLSPNPVIASELEAKAGESNEVFMTPLRTAEAISELAGSGDWDEITNKPSTFPPSSHSHGAITNDGTITANTTIANGHRLAIVDGSSVVRRSSLTFGTSTTQYLRNNGTWGTVDAGTKVTVSTGLPNPANMANGELWVQTSPEIDPVFLKVFDTPQQIGNVLINSIFDGGLLGIRFQSTGNHSGETMYTVSVDLTNRSVLEYTIRTSTTSSAIVQRLRVNTTNVYQSRTTTRRTLTYNVANLNGFHNISFGASFSGTNVNMFADFFSMRIY